MDYAKITVERRERVLLMGLNRPDKLNAFDYDMFLELAQAFGTLHRDNELWCGVLFAHGAHFTSGLEMDKWAEVFASGDMALPEGSIDPLGCDEDRRCGKPVVMAVTGRCYTIGLELLLAQDIRVASTDARFALLEVKRGIYPVGGATVRLFEEIGWGNAMRYLLTGDEMNGAEAYRLGLVQEVVEPARVVERAYEIARDISKRAPLGVQAALRSARIARVEGARAAFARLYPDLMPIAQSEDAMEGIVSFMQRREANFKGK